MTWRASAATSPLLVLLLGRVAGGSQRATCPLSKVENGQNFWTGLPAPAPLAAVAGMPHAGTHAGTHARVHECSHTHRTPHTEHPLQASTPYRTPTHRTQNAVNCSWYQRSSCCSAEDTARISQQEPEIRLLQSSRGCRDVLHMLMCSSCSPRQARARRDRAPSP
jgi:hypothetical protein